MKLSALEKAKGALAVRRQFVVEAGLVNKIMMRVMERGVKTIIATN